ncbi:hypothetical protein N7451_005573, partial [Penicillium sp. IBT 35674x]
VARALSLRVPNDCVLPTVRCQSVPLHQPDQYTSPMRPHASLSHDAEISSGQRFPPDEVLVVSDEGRKIRGFRWLIICTSFYTTCFLYSLDTTVTADLQSAIRSCRSNFLDRSRFSIGLCVCLSIPQYSFQHLHTSTVVLFEAGSALCGAAPTMSAVIVGRVIAGAGASGIYLGSLTSRS